jgi:uncharacterized membrane protein YbhN (UPF0104 family)
VKRPILFSVSILVTVTALYFIFNTISFDDVVNLILRADKRWVLIFGLFSFSMSLCATWRYLLLLSISGYSTSKISMFLVVLVRNLCSDLLPARIGTLVYVFLINKRLGVPVPAALTSFGYAFAFDFVAIAPMIILAAFFSLGSTQFSPVIFFVIGFLLLALMGTFIWFIPKLTRFALPKSLGRVTSFLEKVQKEIEAVSQAKVFAQVLLLSFGVRVFKYLGLWALLLALLTPKGYTLSELPFHTMFLGMCVAEMSATLPISGLAGIGTYQGAWITVFSLLGFPLELATTTSVSHHLFTQAWGYSIGLLALVVLLTPFLKVETANFGYRKPVLLKFICFLFVIASASYALVPKEKGQVEYKGKVNKPSFCSDSCLVVFDSRRGGDFGVYKLTESGVSKVVDKPNRHEMFPDVFGDRVVYASAKGAGRFAESEIREINLITLEDKLVAPNGTFPSFLDDGSIIFERNRKEVVNGKGEVIFPTKEFSDWNQYQVVKPRMKGSKITFTSDRGGRWHVWVVDLETRESKKVSDGCQAEFISERELLFINNKRAKAGSGIFKANLDNNEISVFHDLDGEFGHEYFPSPLRDGVIFGATNEKDHSHEEGNYQLFFISHDGKRERITEDNVGSRWARGR